MSRRDEYRVTIAAASPDLEGMGRKEMIKLKGLDDTLKIKDELMDSDGLLLDVLSWVLLDVHNERAKDGKDYQVIKLITEDGRQYVSGSSSLINHVQDIWADLFEGDDGADPSEAVSIKVFSKPSKTKGGVFYVAALV